MPKSCDFNHYALRRAQILAKNESYRARIRALTLIFVDERRQSRIILTMAPIGKVETG